MAKNETYRQLPEGPVLCDACARSGSRIEMEREDSLPPEALKWSVEKDTGLQSYRCPECESVQVFRIS